MSEPEPDDSRAPDSRRAAVAALIFIVLLVLGGILLEHVLRATSQLQDCVMSGRSNCAPIDSGNPNR
jgi:hypothetical protein